MEAIDYRGELPDTQSKSNYRGALPDTQSILPRSYLEHCLILKSGESKTDLDVKAREPQTTPREPKTVQ